MKIRKPFHLQNWINENKHLLKPPVSNKNIYLESDNYIVMVVGGPNARKDFHYNETEELFYQLEGTIQIDIQNDGKREAIKLHPGEIFLLPAKTPHSPIRTEGSVGLVIEYKHKPKNAKDGLLWYCDNCNEKLHEVFFVLKDIEKDFLKHFRDFYSNEKLRTCSSCGHIMEADERFI